jgi:methylated-DNA-[protein]-cysteine S-methyltransferase
VEVTGTKRGVTSLTFHDQARETWFTPWCLKDCMTQIKEYFDGSRDRFTVRLDLIGTPFQMKVWEELQKIPYGKTISYHDLAARVGEPGAMRAVGQADAKNPVPIIIPCHRVISLDGKLTGYAGGLWRKKWLLEHEHAFAQKDLFY